MDLTFISKELPKVSIKINGTIKKAIDSYRKSQIPMFAFISDYLAVKSGGDPLYKADNPFSYYYKGMKKYPVERGVSVHEAEFTFSAMELKNELPSEVINAAFYSDKNRNDSDFEIGYLLPLFLNAVSNDDSILIVNPSPDMICNIEASGCNCKKKMYAVPDETIANLYAIQFPSSIFFPFAELTSIDDVDIALITNRDQKISEAKTLLGFLPRCKNNTKIIGLIPTAWFDNNKNGNSLFLTENHFSITQALIVDTKATNSSPRKKMLAIIEQKQVSSFELFFSGYNQKIRLFEVQNNKAEVDTDRYLNTDITLLACWKEIVEPVKETTEPKYNKSNEYVFSKEISLFYKIYANRKNRYCGVAHYNEITNTNPIIRGNKISPDIEKGLRAESKEEIIKALGSLVFNEKLYPIIRSDLEKNYIGIIPVTLKTLWFYFWNELADSPRYDHNFMAMFFENYKAADVIPQMQSGEIILEALSETLNVSKEDIAYKYVLQIDTLLSIALKHKVIPFNPLSAYIAEYTKRASERQQDVRNALVKKHLLDSEEKVIFQAIIGPNAPFKYLCSEKSILLATAIRLFTGMTIREVAALDWCDFRPIGTSDNYQFLITKSVDQNGHVISNSEKSNWNRFRIIPSAKVLTLLLLARKQHLIDNGINEDYLKTCPVILAEERLSDMKRRVPISHCKPRIISKSGNELIKLANIPENIVVLPDEKNDLTTDFNRYHGDILQVNFLSKANHSALMTMGEINYILGIEAPDTFSRYYCDYTNDFIQTEIIQKLSRWEIVYERLFSGTKLSLPSHGEKNGKATISVGPYKDGLASVDLIIDNNNDAPVDITIKSTHGIDVNTTKYKKQND